MPSKISTTRNWFDQDGDRYARFRPHYPPGLAEFLSSLAPDGRCALDVGCGNGQLTRQLADHFAAVVGLDPSTEQLGSAVGHSRIRYQCAPAEQLPLPDDSVSLVTAAQAAHWFDLPVFYREVRRVAVCGGVIALISYGRPALEPVVDDGFQRFYQETIGPFWPPERTLVESGYAAIPFPFEALATPRMAIRAHWTLAELLGYVSTWSAVRRAREAGREDLLQTFERDMTATWSAPDVRRLIAWPLGLRVGRIS